LRITLGVDSSPAHVDEFLKVLPALVEKVRVLNRK